MEGLIVSQRFALVPGGPKRLEVKHTVGWNEVSLSVDGHELGTTDGDTLKDSGLDFALHDNSLLHVWLESDFRGQLMLCATLDGKPIPRTAADPNVWIRPAAGLMLIIGVPQVPIAIAMLISGKPVLLLLASGIALTAAGIAAWGRSAPAILVGGLITCIEIGWFLRTAGTFRDASDWLRFTVAMFILAALMIRAATAASA